MMNNSHRLHSGFTLIELLVVVAVIAILAAIALPNFLEAQTRAKVSRTKADMKTLATVVEAYTVDHNRPPYDGEPGETHYGWVNIWKAVTTPVAYTGSLFPAVFQDDGMAESPLPGHTNFLSPSNKRKHVYDYSTAYWERVATDPGQKATWGGNFGNTMWKVTSPGPDLEFDNAGSFYGQRELYDPTNGTISMGDLVKTQGKSS